MVFDVLTPLADPQFYLLFSPFSHMFANASAPVGNLFVTSATIHCILLILQNGAGGNTAREIEKVLEFRNDTTPIECVQARNSESVSIDSKLYLANGIAIKDQFKENLVTQGVEYETLNFTNQDQASAAINVWINSKTNNQTGNLVLPDQLDTWSQIILVSVNYFNASWLYPFNKNNTRLVPFYTLNNSSVNVSTMYLKQQLKYGQISELDSQVLLLPYEGNRTSLLIIFPDAVDGIYEVRHKALTIGFQNLRSRLINLEETLIDLYLPKFNFTFSDNLEPSLRMLGLNESFQPGIANFSGISDSPLYLSYLGQISTIYVDEEGTKADGSTSFQVDEDNAAFIEPITITGQPPLYVNHPFLFFILDSDIHNVSFEGGYVVP